jgi:hypothetical protein
MVDCKGSNAVAVHNLQPDIAIVGCYVTGTSDIAWTVEEKDLWSEHVTLVSIDQGYESPVKTTAIVRDVEPECWSAVSAVDRASWDSTVTRPTIYTDLDMLPEVLEQGWDGDLWLAIPGWGVNDALPEHGSCTVVAVQNEENVSDLYDSSIVIDPYWPERKPAVTTQTETQAGWNWCAKCQGLFYGPKIKESACPRGGTHEDNGSGNYTLTVEVTS